MANSYIGKDDWGEESNSSPSTVEQTKASVSRGSWENEKVLEGENKLEQLRRNLVNIQDLQDSFKKSASELNETTKETKLMTRDMLQAVPQVKKIGENLMALTKVIKNDFTNVPLSVSQESYDTVEDKLNGRVNSVLDAAVDRCADRINTKINEGISEGKQKADKVEKHLEEIYEKFTEKMSANAQARLDILQKKIDKKEEQIKELERKAGGVFITNGQLMYLLVNFLVLWAVAMWGYSKLVEPWKAPAWVGILLAIAFLINLIWYSIRWLVKHIPGNND